MLVVAIYKFDRLEWAIEKCTELGVTRIVPVIARRTDAHLAAAAGKRVERWRRIAHEAAQQSRRLRPPQIDEAVKLKSALALEAPTRLLLNENERSRKNFRDALSEAATAGDFCGGTGGRMDGRRAGAVQRRGLAKRDPGLDDSARRDRGDCRAGGCGGDSGLITKTLRFTRINTKGNAFALPSRVAFSCESCYFFFATFFAAFFTAFFAAFLVAMTILPLNNLGL